MLGAGLSPIRGPWVTGRYFAAFLDRRVGDDGRSQRQQAGGSYAAEQCDPSFDAGACEGDT